LDTTSLLSICTIALAAVFLLLSFLAVAMHLVTVIFTARDTRIDPAVVAAVSAAISSVMPGARVIKIEEES
jgi:type IV secretory pathway VirB3-like protein